MGAWIESVEAKAAIIHGQLAAARSLAERHGGRVEETSRPYLELLRRLYEEEFPFARMADSSDLVARFGGPSVDHDDPAVSVVTQIFADLRDQIRSIAKSIVGLSTDRRLRWPSDLDPHLAGVAQGSLLVGIRVPGPSAAKSRGETSLPEVSEQIFESVRSAVRSLSVVARYVHEDSVDEEIRDEFPDPAIRDTVMVAAARLAPTGRRGIDSVMLYGPQPDPAEAHPLTPRSRTILSNALSRPVKVRGSGSFEGVVREIDLDACRFEIRGVEAIGAIRCVYDPQWSHLTRKILDARVRIRGTYETLQNQLPRLVAVESIEQLGSASEQAAFDFPQSE